MGMSLEQKLEPLLAKLKQVAEAKFRKDEAHDAGGQADVKHGLKIFDSDLSTLMTKFRGYYSLDGHDLDWQADHFAVQSDQWQTPTGNSVYCAIARASSNVDDVEKLIGLGNWQGTAADTFYHNFLKPFHDTAVTHSGCAIEMAAASKMLADGVERAKECVVWVCKDLINCLSDGEGDIHPGPLPGDGKSGGGGDFLSIVDDVITLFSWLIPAIEALETIGVLLAILDLTSQSTSSAHEEPLSITYRSGSTNPSAKALVLDTLQSLKYLDQNIEELDDYIHRALETDLGPSGPFGSPSARIQSPHLDPTTYRQLDFTGLDDAHDKVVVSVVQLYYAGYRILPEAANWYDYGNKVSTGAHIDKVQRQFPKAVKIFNEAAQTFGGLLNAVRGELTDSAHTMMKAATTYSEADQYEAGQIKRLESQIPAPENFAGVDHYIPPEWLQP